MLWVQCDGGHGCMRPDAASQHESQLSSGGDVWSMAAAKLAAAGAVEVIVQPQKLFTFFMSSQCCPRDWLSPSQAGPLAVLYDRVAALAGSARLLESDRTCSCFQVHEPRYWLEA